MRCGVPSIPLGFPLSPFLGKGRKVTRGWFFIPTHSNPTTMRMLAPEHGFQSLSLQMHWACTPGDTALTSCAPVPAAEAGPGHPTPTSFGQQQSQQTPAQPKPAWQLFIHSNIYKGIKWIFLWSHCHAAEEASVLLIPKPGAGDEDPVVASRILQQLQPSGMSLQPWFVLDLVEGELSHPLDLTEHQMISCQGQGPVLSC